jgi:hypothetical protein
MLITNVIRQNLLMFSGCKMINTEVSELLQQSFGNNETYCDDTASAQTAQICRHVLRMPGNLATDDSREGASRTAIGL